MRMVSGPLIVLSGSKEGFCILLTAIPQVFMLCVTTAVVSGAAGVSKEDRDIALACLGIIIQL